uniref:Importin subunit alpha n=1 Tax=Albugo laibachii Nc14 TaxID=890382 RepID=F0X172_9STRA|nr:importin subunit alpha putative [Albugo laibachii Nc14]|eukprot:CCA27530.1 importin subunit alpha putative [Albugo laibachii Nc14]
MPPRNSLRKHDTNSESRATKARRNRQTVQIRKDKRNRNIEEKRRRINIPSDDTSALPSSRDITEITEILATSTAKDCTKQHQIQFGALKELRYRLSVCEQAHNYAQVDRICESGIVPVLVEILESASPLAAATRRGEEVYKEILWCLANIASGQYEETKLVLPAIPRILELLQNGSAIVAEHAAFVIGNIAADCEEFRQALIAQGAIHPLLVQAEAIPTDKQLSTSCAWALSNLARGPNISAIPFLEAGVLQTVTRGLTRNPSSFTEDTLVELLWLLSFLTSREDLILAEFIKQPVMELLLPYFGTPNELVLTPILRIIGNICCGAKDQQVHQEIVQFVHHLVLQSNSVLLTKILEFLQPENEAKHISLAAESAWVVSNLATLDLEMVQKLIQHAFIAVLIQQFRNGNSELRREVSFALTNIALTSPEHLGLVLARGDDLLKHFLELLKMNETGVVGNSLRFIEYVLRFAPNGVLLVESLNGIEALENVQFRQDEAHLSEWAASLVDTYYGENYGVHSPQQNDRDGNSSDQMMCEDDSSNTTFVGRGRGAQMTLPAWKQ